MNSISTANDTKETIQKEGYCIVQGKDFKIKKELKKEWKTLKETWNDLRTDPYMSDGGTYRLRRYGRFNFNPKNEILTKLPHAPFVQSKTYNTFAGGIQRWFEPLHEKTFNNKFLQELIKHNFKQLPIKEQEDNWEISINQTRIKTNNKETGNPTPEGIHEDGFEYFTVHLIQKENVQGATSRIYNRKKQLIKEHTLEKPLDTLYVNDKKLLHDVTLVKQQEEKKEATRDVLIINYYKPKTNTTQHTTQQN